LPGFPETYSLNTDELVLECRVRGTPRPHIAWIKDGDYIIPGDKYEQYETAEGTCKLVICTPEESDCGTYTCEAECGGVSDTISHNVHFEGANAYMLQKVHGFYHRSTIKPHFTIGLTDNSVCSGGSIILNVEAPANCEAKWYRDKVLMKQKLPKIRMFAENGFFGLAVQNATMDESGAYTCRIENSFGTNETTSHVDVVNPNAVKGLKPPIFFARPQPEIRIRCGDPLSMSFRVNGEPKPKSELKGN
jgi:Immunoglobulin I-set domain